MRKYFAEKQHEKNKLHAYERIALLFDENSFREIEPPTEDDYDGVIVGCGTISKKTVYVFAQDFTMHGGTISLKGGRMIANIIDLAIKEKCPIIGIYDSGGARIGDGINALAGCGEVIYQNVRASGVIPQIAIVAGPCAGAAAYSSQLNDFVFTIKNITQLYITGSRVIEVTTGEKGDLRKLGDAVIHSAVSGVTHFISDSEKDCFDEVRRLISILPTSSEDRRHLCSDGFMPNDNDITSIVPENGRYPYSMPEFIEKVFDGSFIEVQKSYAGNAVVGFAKLSGMTVGVAANNPQIKSGCLDINSSDKIARFVRFCDAFSIPIVTFVDTPGYLPGIEEERGGIIRHGAKVFYAYSEATTVKITVVIRKAYGGAYIAMGSKQVGADAFYASPYAEMAVMGAEGAVAILHHRELKNNSENAAELKNKFIKEYQDRCLNSHDAVKAGYVDEILDFKDIRKRLYDDILRFKNKRSFSEKKKHGNIPL